MLESQLLLPMGASRQWAIKGAVVLGVALVLAIGLPAVLIYAAGPADLLRGALPQILVSVALIVALTASSLYVSSLSSSGMRALALSFAFVVAAATLLQFVATAMTRNFFTSGRFVQEAGGATSVLLAALLLCFGAVNHRYAERGFRRILWQIGCVAAVIAIGFPLIAAVLALTN